MLINKLKGFAKDSILYGIGGVVGRLINIILVPILTRIFVPSDYGIIDLLSVSYTFILIFSTLNCFAGFQKFYYLKENTDRPVFVSSILFGRIVITIILASIIIIFAKQISEFGFNTTEYSTAIRILGLCLPLEALYNFLILLMRLKRKPILFSLCNIILTILTIITTYYCVVCLEIGITGVFIAKITAFFSIVVFAFIFVRNEFTKHININMFKKIVLFSLPGFPALIISSINNLLPLYILTYFTNLYVVGIYSIATRIARIMNLYQFSFQRAWSPFAFSNSGKDDEKEIYEKVFKVYSASIIIIGMILSLYAKEILNILTPLKYHAANKYVGGLCIFLGLSSLRLIFNTALYSVNKVKYTSYLNFIQIIIFLVLCIILVPLYDARGLIISLDVSAITFITSYYFIVKRYLYFKIEILRLIMIFLLACCGVIYFNYFDIKILPELLFKIIFMVVFLIISYCILFTKNEKNVIRKNIFVTYRRDRL